MRTLCLLFLLLSSASQAANSLMIWPVDPVINPEEKASELWLENHGNASTIMQVRIFAWQQRDNQEQYQTQQQVVASPPMVRLEPGQKQLVRLIKQSAPAAGQESAYRIVLDEIPVPRTPGENQAGLNFQMRYSVPLFVYGNGLTRDRATPGLSWREVSSGNKRWLELTNNGNGHARLSDVKVGGTTLGNGLFGYVLAQSSQRWPVTHALRGELTARVNKSQWRSAAAR